MKSRRSRHRRRTRVARTYTAAGRWSGVAGCGSAAVSWNSTRPSLAHSSGTAQVTVVSLYSVVRCGISARPISRIRSASGPDPRAPGRPGDCAGTSCGLPNQRRALMSKAGVTWPSSASASARRGAGSRWPPLLPPRRRDFAGGARVNAS
ncbi:hypothetical protein RVR_10513 [Actinacidiphila reveromycinica]|uniref:Uncharacterized protein n=1 Tax=Actinacidiphila reveromycinica TaxID=659352 RepID=A0A7U3UQU6_9ACTN|nr:hypothetical protein RVR_10513 [Streptomyces sp. SN-593]